jgi:hypothetical protein
MDFKEQPEARPATNITPAIFTLVLFMLYLRVDYKKLRFQRMSSERNNKALEKKGQWFHDLQCHRLDFYNASTMPSAPANLKNFWGWWRN